MAAELDVYTPDMRLKMNYGDSCYYCPSASTTVIRKTTKRLSVLALNDYQLQGYLCLPLHCSCPRPTHHKPPPEL